MTPDELRRMDNDLCIIFEKGIKPVKARKYYFFEKPKMYKELMANKLDHNNFDAGVRGEWRKYNPYNPYVPETDKKVSENLKVESLDDLFEDDIDSNETALEGLLNENTFKEEPKEIKFEEVKKEPVIDLLDFEDFDSPTLPQDKEEKPQLFTEDMQKELEAKFDELFGPMED